MKKNEEIKAEETVVEEVKEVAVNETTEPEKEKLVTKVASKVKKHGKTIAKGAIALGIGVAAFALGAKSSGKRGCADTDDYSDSDYTDYSSDDELE